MLNIKTKGEDILSITLLSIEEARSLPIEVREYVDWWWLRSPGDRSDHAAYVCCGGSVDNYGGYVSVNSNGVRPVLTIKNLKSYAPELYSDILINGKKLIVIDEDKVLYSDKPVYHYFNKTLKRGNDYEKSDVKRFVENEFLEIVWKE